MFEIAVNIWSIVSASSRSTLIGERRDTPMTSWRGCNTVDTARPSIPDEPITMIFIRSTVQRRPIARA
jgi:hypothetical protein